MEKLCKIRDLQRAVVQFETGFEKLYHICLNEGMLLCSLSKVGQLTSGEIADLLGLTTSNTSKVIRSAENKHLIERVVGQQDKRQMYFSLTSEGKNLLSGIDCHSLELPELLQTALEK